MTDRPTPDERRFRALANGSVERIAELDSRGRTIYVSPNHAIKGDDALASLDHVHPDDRAVVAAEFAAVYGHGEGRRISFRVCELDGSTRWVESTLTPFPGEDAQRHVLVVSRDVTEARLLEQSLRESRERFQLVAENAYDMISEYDDQWRLLYANERVQKVLGVGEGTPGVGVVHPEDRERVKVMFGRVLDGRDERGHDTYRIRRADGTWCWVDGTLRSVQRADGKRNHLIIARDVTARVEAEQRVRESEQRYRTLVEKTPLGIVVIQGDAIVYANPAAAAIGGASSPEALCGTKIHQLLQAEDFEAVTHQFARARQGHRLPDNLDLRIRGLDGEERHVVGAGSLTTYGGAPAFQGIVRDVTELERSRREQEGLELQLQEARKLESLGVLAGGIAHDFNNLLAVILSSVRYARAGDSSSEDRIDALSDAEEAAESAARLVRQLLAYAGRRSPEVRSVDLSELAGSLSELLRTALPAAVELRLELDPEPVPVHADLVQLEQVLMNLVLNAAEAVGEGPGRVTVRTARRSVPARELAGWLGGDDLEGGAYACLEVEDTGVGMTAETRARIFDPFFTTKEAGHGLGLSAVLGLVQGHRGAIDVRSSPGAGTRFRIVLPADPVQGRPARPDSDAPVVLVADADPGFRQLAVGALRSRAIQVLEAGDAAQALDLWARHAEELDAAVLGADLSAFGGRSLLRTLRSSRPELPILSVHAADDEPDTTLRMLASALLAKPCTERELRDRVSELLAKRDRSA